VQQVAARGLDDIDGQITNPFEIGVDLDGRDDRPEVDRHGLVQRQQLERSPVDLDVQRVGDGKLDELDAGGVAGGNLRVPDRPGRVRDVGLPTAEFLEASAGSRDAHRDPGVVACPLEFLRHGLADGEDGARPVNGDVGAEPSWSRPAGRRRHESNGQGDAQTRRADGPPSRERTAGSFAEPFPTR
jgi:hypothetical protein